MSYRVIYRDLRGNELTDRPCSSINEVNERIGDLHDAFGLVLRIEQDHDGPRTWAIEYPPAPPTGTRVRDKRGTLRVVAEGGYINTPEGPAFSWQEALEHFAPFTEVVETEVEAAARRLREAGFDKDLKRPLFDYFDELQTVVVHVLNGGQL